MKAQLCSQTSKSTGQRCQQPERWSLRSRDGDLADVCQQHGRMLERQGWSFQRELHPVAGFERVAGEVQS